METSKFKRQTNNLIPAIRAAIGPTLAVVGPLQERVAFIAAASKRPMTAVERNLFRTDLHDIRAAAAAETAALRRRIAALPKAAADHSRVVDAARALDRLVASLDSISGALDSSDS